MSGRYEDLIGLDRPVSKNHSPMPMAERAAQFAPFAALSGFEAVIDEAGRLTARPSVLGEDSREELSRRLTILAAAAADRPEVEVTWFEPDALKLGGEYRSARVRIRRVDEALRVLELEDHSTIPIDRIFELRGELFAGTD